MLFIFVDMANTQDVLQSSAQYSPLPREVEDPQEESRLAFERMKALSNGLTVREATKTARVECPSGKTLAIHSGVALTRESQKR